MRDLKGKYALVTGSGQGIGKAAVRRFLEDHCAGVAMLDISDNVFEAAKDLDPSGKRTLPIRCDVSDALQVAAAVKKTIKTFGQVDILVNNAAALRDRIFHKMTREEWDFVIDVNLGSVFNLCHELVPHMREREYGRIVNITSTSAFGNVGQANYSASKAGIIGFTKTLALECAKKNVIVNCIAPGHIDTALYNTVPPETLAQFQTSIPRGCLGVPSEIASVVSFLSSDDVMHMTGQVLIVSGGTDT